MRSSAALILFAACTVGQARTAHRAGEIAAGGSLIGILAVVAAAELIPSQSTNLLEGGVVFVPICVLGALTYAATDGMVQATPPEVKPDRAREAALELAREAKHAAGRGDCAEVLAIEPRVRDLDLAIYGRFRRDEIIARCYAPEPTGD